MYLLLIIIHKEELLEDVLSCLVELGVTDAVIIDTQSMGKVLAYKVPIFAGLRFQLGGGRPYSKTILALSDDKNIGDQVANLLKEVDIDIETPGIGRIITVKIESLFGTPEEIPL